MFATQTSPVSHASDVCTEQWYWAAEKQAQAARVREDARQHSNQNPTERAPTLPSMRAQKPSHQRLSRAPSASPLTSPLALPPNRAPSPQRPGRASHPGLPVPASSGAASSSLPISPSTSPSSRANSPRRSSIPPSSDQPVSPPSRAPCPSQPPSPCRTGSPAQSGFCALPAHTLAKGPAKTSQEYAEWYAKQEGTDKVVGCPSQEEYAQSFQEKLSGMLGRRKVPKAAPLLSMTYNSTKCRYCKTNFEGRSGQWLSRHEKECSILTCEHCCKTFKTPLELKGHLSVCEQHLQNRCEFCAARMTNTAQKRVHELTCEMNPALWCDWCGAKFHHQSLRVRHQRCCPNNPDKFCPHCNEKFPSRIEAVVHAVFCRACKKCSAEPATCSACCDDGQCIRFPCGNHLFCAQCLFQQVRHGLRDRSMLPLRCCRVEVQPGDAVDRAVAQMLSEESREKYQETMMMKIAKDVMYCPRADCGALIVLDDFRASSLTLDGPHGCPKCQQALCFECKSEWHAGMTCAQYQWVAAKSKDAITKFCLAMNWMRCFECGHVAEKKAGCNHITCICGAQFCYVCGMKWGECKCQVFSAGHALRHNRVLADNMRTCRWCQQAYPSELELQAHVRVCRRRMDAAGGAFECASCFDRFPTSDALRSHRRHCRAFLDGEYTCSRCHVTLEDSNALRRHKRTCGVDLDVC